MACNKKHTRNLTDLESHRMYSNRVIEEYFNVTDIDIVSLRYFNYLYQTDRRIDIFNDNQLKGDAPRLRKVNFIDLMNQEIEDKFREPYFIFADVSDYANYNSYKSNGITINNNKGFIYYTGKSIIDDENESDKISYDGTTNIITHIDEYPVSPLLTGRGTITIDMEQENAGKIYYRVRIATLPHFIKWAYIVIRYITKGYYNIELEI